MQLKLGTHELKDFYKQLENAPSELIEKIERASKEFGEYEEKGGHDSDKLRVNLILKNNI